MFKDARIGDGFIRICNGLVSVVTNKTSTSIELFNKRESDKGIDSTQWYEARQFEKEFRDLGEDLQSL